MAKKRWIKDAVNPAHKGEFKAKAEKAGETTRQYAEEKKDASGALGKQARLALTLMGMHKKSKGAKQPDSKSMRAKMYGEKDGK